MENKKNLSRFGMAGICLLILTLASCKTGELNTNKRSKKHSETPLCFYDPGTPSMVSKIEFISKSDTNMASIQGTAIGSEREDALSISGRTVIFTNNQDSSKIFQVKTDSLGHYHLEIAPGEYEMTVDWRKPLLDHVVKVAPGSLYQINFRTGTSGSYTMSYPDEPAKKKRTRGKAKKID